MSYISVIGAGSWGTTIACMLTEKGYDVVLWVHDSELAERINEKGENDVYLPGFKLPTSLRATNDIEQALNKSRYVINAVPSQYTRAVFKNVKDFLKKDATIVSVSKGIERGTLMTVSSILKELCNREISVLSGPSFAKEVIKKLPTAVTIASNDKTTALMLQEIFNLSYFRVYTHDDVLGVELGGALKNVIAIASGISDSLSLGYNARASLITRGIAEIKRLGVAMGANIKTFSGLSGIGDLVLTCTSNLSRNYTVGVKLGQGNKLEDVVSNTKSIAEGITTAESAYELSKKHGIEMPIVEQVYKVIYENKDPSLAVRDLLERPLKKEFYE